MDSTLPYKGWVFTLGFVFLVTGTVAFLWFLIPGVEKVVQSKHIQELIGYGGFTLFGTGMCIVGLTEENPLAKSLIFIVGTLLASAGTLLFLLTMFGILP